MTFGWINSRTVSYVFPIRLMTTEALHYPYGNIFILTIRYLDDLLMENPSFAAVKVVLLEENYSTLLC